MLEDYELNNTEDIDKDELHSPAEIASNTSPEKKGVVERIFDKTPGEDPASGKSVDMQDVSLTLRSRSESITKSKTGEGNAGKKSSKNNFNDTSQSFSVRFSNIFGAPKDIYIPGLDDDPKP